MGPPWLPPPRPKHQGEKQKNVWMPMVGAVDD